MLKEAILRLHPTAREVVTRRLNKLYDAEGVTRRFVDNLNVEHRLAPDAWDRLLRAIWQAKEEPAALKTAITGVFRTLILRGKGISRPWPRTYGRAISDVRFLAYLQEVASVDTPDQAEALVTKLLSLSAAEVRRELGHIHLGAFLIWATYDPRKPHEPFHGIPNDSVNMRAALGLPPEDRQHGLLAFTYNLPHGVTPRFPTVADAYAGEAWPYFFHVATETELSGSTLTWPEYHGPPRPEVVHQPITGSCCSGPVVYFPGGQP